MTRLVRAPGFIARRIAGELVVVPVVSVETSAGSSLPFFVLNEPGALLWSALDSPSDFESLVRILTEAFEVTAERARSDVEAFVRELRVLGAVTALEES